MFPPIPNPTTEPVPPKFGEADLIRLTGEEDKLPEVGKYNAGQKLYFWMMSVLIVVLFATGIVIWQQYFAEYTTVERKRVAVLVHSIAAIVAICVWIVHVYAVRGTISAMTRGRVTGGWAWRHHRRWLRDLVSGRRSRLRGRAPERSRGPCGS